MTDESATVSASVTLHRSSGRRTLGLSLAAVTMGIWSGLPLVLGVLLEVMSPATITWYRFLLSTLCVAAALAWRGELPNLRALSKPDAILLVVATVGLAINYITYLIGLERTSPASIQVLIQAAPLLLALGGLLIFRERFSRLQWIGFGILVASLATFFGSQLVELVGDARRYSLGVVAIAVAAVAWAIYGLAQKQLLRVLSSPAIMLCLFAGCTLCFTPFARPSTILDLNGEALLALGLATGATVVAYGCFASSLNHVEASRVSAVLALVPLGTLAMTFLATGIETEHFAAEELSALSLTGLAGVVVGSLITALGGADYSGGKGSSGNSASERSGEDLSIHPISGE